MRMNDANDFDPGKNSARTTAIRWGQDRRLDFIDFRLRWDGRINRGDLKDFFGISVPQASLDIARYTELAPGNLTYDRSSRVYIATQEFSPARSHSQPQRYLNELLASETDALDEDATFIGWRPNVACVPQPGRNVDPDILATVLRAIRNRTGLNVVYQSMSRAEPSSRILSPHALAYDGFRWHVRAFCHSRERFLDFVLGRFISVIGSEPVGKSSDEDFDWKTELTLVLAPHPGLTDGKRRAIELDYGMEDGELKMKCRYALLFYTMRQLGLDDTETTRAEAQQIILKNRDELSSYLSSNREAL